MEIQYKNDTLTTASSTKLGHVGHDDREKEAYHRIFSQIDLNIGNLSYLRPVSRPFQELILSHVRYISNHYGT